MSTTTPFLRARGGVGAGDANQMPYAALVSVASGDETEPG